MFLLQIILYSLFSLKFPSLENAETHKTFLIYSLFLVLLLAYANFELLKSVLDVTLFIQASTNHHYSRDEGGGQVRFC